MTWTPPAEWPISDSPTVVVCLSQPRLTFSAQSTAVMRAVTSLKCLDIIQGGGSLWEAGMVNAIEMALERNSDYLLFCDYDSVFTNADVQILIKAMQEHPEYAIVYPIQASRHVDGVMVENPDADYSGELTQTRWGHFGLTLARTELFRQLPHPWFWAMPNPETMRFGSREGGVDADISFWRILNEYGVKFARHNEVQVGHIEECVFWSGEGGKRIGQPMRDYVRKGRPTCATWRGPQK